MDEVEIVIIEDCPEDIELIMRALRKHNLANDVKVIDDGQVALDYLMEQGNGNVRQPKVIFLDLKLPKVDGTEILRQVKANEKTKNIPVVVLTSSKEQPDLDECYQLGVNSYIVKPVEFESFLKAVSDLGFYWLLLNNPAR
jgi:two-component system response regulator